MKESAGYNPPVDINEWRCDELEPNINDTKLITSGKQKLEKHFDYY